MWSLVVMVVMSGVPVRSGPVMHPHLTLREVYLPGHPVLERLVVALMVGSEGQRADVNEASWRHISTLLVPIDGFYARTTYPTTQDEVISLDSTIISDTLSRKTKPTTTHPRSTKPSVSGVEGSHHLAGAVEEGRVHVTPTDPLHPATSLPSGEPAAAATGMETVNNKEEVRQLDDGKEESSLGGGAERPRAVVVDKGYDVPAVSAAVSIVSSPSGSLLEDSPQWISRVSHITQDPSLTVNKRDPKMIVSTQAPSLTIVTQDPSLTTGTPDPSLTTDTLDSSLATDTLDPSLNTDTLDPSLTTDILDPSLNTDTLDPSLTTNTMDLSLTTDTQDPSLTTDTPDSSLTIDRLDPSLTTDTLGPSLTTDTLEPSLTTDTPDPSLTTDTLDPSLTTDTLDPSLTTDTQDPSLTTDTLDPSLTTDTLDPSLTTDTLDPSLIIDMLDPSLTTDTLDSSLITDTLDPSLTTDTLGPSLTTDTLDPSLNTDTLDPSLTTDTLDPSLTTDTLDPSLTTDTLDPSLTTDTLDPSLITDIMDPSLITDIMDPSLTTDTLDPSLTTDTLDPRAVPVQDEVVPSVFLPGGSPDPDAPAPGTIIDLFDLSDPLRPSFRPPSPAALALGSQGSLLRPSLLLVSCVDNHRECVYWAKGEGCVCPHRLRDSRCQWQKYVRETCPRSCRVCP